MEISAPMGGTVWKILVVQGEKVEEGQELLILESMKMEIPVTAGSTGTVCLLKAEGDFVQEDDIILMIN